MVVCSRGSPIIVQDNTGRPFKCQVNHTHGIIPTSVHALRPEDVKVVAAIGDSLSAGMGIYSSSLLTIFLQYRGHSFTMGGADPLSTHATMPSILKMFNEQLIGYSTGISGPDGVNAHLNVAVVGDKAEDMPMQARKLVARMKQQKNINFEKDWKVVNLFIGGNDICDYCKDPARHSPANYKKHIMEALDYLQASMPRTFVNLMEVVDASNVNELSEQGLKCKALLSTFWCKCPASRPQSESHAYVMDLQQAARDIVADDRYDTKEDFTVVLQPFFQKTQPPRIKPGQIDMDYLAPDCFHFSAKAHAEAGVALWNNMLQPVGSKDVEWKINQPIACPTEEKPFLCTKKNC